MAKPLKGRDNFKEDLKTWPSGERGGTGVKGTKNKGGKKPRECICRPSPEN